MQGIAVVIFCLPFVGTYDLVNEKLDQLTPALVHAESVLENTDACSCLRKLFCLIETEEADDFDNPIKEAARYLTNDNGDVDPIEFHHIKLLIKQFPHTSQVVDSIHLGKLNRRSSDCENSLPECSIETNELLAATTMFNNTDVTDVSSAAASSTTTECNVARGVCSALRVACAICTFFTGGACALVCGPPLVLACSVADAICSAG